MTVTAEYAKRHLDELLKVVDAGEEVRIEREGQPIQIKLAPESSETIEVRPRSEFIGSAKGQIWMRDDFDSQETSDELADLFENSVLIPSKDAH